MISEDKNEEEYSEKDSSEIEEKEETSDSDKEAQQSPPSDAYSEIEAIVEAVENQPQERRTPRYLSNPQKFRSITIGFILAFLFSSIVSFTFNINRLVQTSYVIKHIENFFMMTDCLKWIFAIFMASMFVFVPISFLLALRWKRKTQLALFLLATAIYFLQYLKIPHLQRLLTAKIIYEGQKKVAPFVRTKWDKFIFKNLIKDINTRMKTSIQIFENKIVGTDNTNGKNTWTVRLSEKHGMHVAKTLQVFGDSFVYVENMRVISRKINNGIINWVLRTKVHGVSNFASNEDVLAFYCKQCHFQKQELAKEKSKFFGNIVLIKSDDGKVKKVYNIPQTYSERKGPVPKLHYFENKIFLAYPQSGRFVYIDKEKIWDNSFTNYLYPKGALEDMLSLKRTAGRQVLIKGAKLYFYQKYLFVNTPRDLKLIDLFKRKERWSIQKGFLNQDKEQSSEEMVWIKYNDKMIVQEQGEVYAVDMNKGKIVWGPKDGEFIGEPIILNNILYVCSQEKGGIIYVLHAPSGKYLYRWGQHKKIKFAYTWKDYIFFTGKDNLGMPRKFAFQVQ